MDRLELAQELRRECGISGSEATTVDASGEWSDVINWIDKAWLAIQNERPDWLWMRKTASFTTVAQQAEYPYASAPLSLTDFAEWVDGTFRIYKTTIADETWLNQWLSYDQFRDAYLYGTLRASYSQPTEIVVSPTKSLILALPPDDTSYTVSGDYRKAPAAMTGDSGVPDMPERFHMLIVFRAMMYFGAKESAAETYDHGQKEYKILRAQLMRDQLPQIVSTGKFVI